MITFAELLETLEFALGQLREERYPTEFTADNRDVTIARVERVLKNAGVDLETVD